MAKGLPIIRRRIGSIKATKKVTKAMQMIATTKLKTWKQSMMESKLYAEKLIAVVQNNLKHELLMDSVFFKVGPQLPKLYLLVSSNLGLCGSYNYNVFTYYLQSVQAKDFTFTIGEKAVKFLKHLPYAHQNDFVQAGNLTEASLTPLIHHIVEKFKQRVVGEVNIIYTSFINSLIFQPKTLTLLPLTVTTFKNQASIQPPLIEPDPLSVFEKLVPFYLKNSLYAVLIESQVSEQSARRNAMEKASDNADELIEQLQLEFNKQRQANITQEIAEIIGGSAT